MRPENPFKLSTDPFDGRARALIADVGVKTHAKHLPDLECMAQHEQLGFCVGASADGGTRQPGVADFTGVGHAATMVRMAFGP